MYTLSVTGRSPRRDLIVGYIVTNSANMTQQFSCTEKEVCFHFQYRSCARTVLRRAMRQFGLNSESCDHCTVPGDNLSLKVRKQASRT